MPGEGIRRPYTQKSQKFPRITVIQSNRYPPFDPGLTALMAYQKAPKYIGASQL